LCIAVEERIMKLLVIGLSAFALSAAAVSIAAQRPQTETSGGLEVGGETQTRVSTPTDPVLRQRLPGDGGAVGLARMPVEGTCYSDAATKATAEIECQELLKCGSGKPKCLPDKNRQEWRCKC
jgi:hypothetical protein